MSVVSSLSDNEGDWEVNSADGESAATPITQTPTSPRSVHSQPDPQPDPAPEPPLPWHEEVATQLFHAGRKVKRLEKLQQRLQDSVFFDHDDVRRVQSAIAVEENKIESLHGALTKEEVMVIKLFITLKQRESELEEVIAQNMLSVEDDTELFQALVKKQVYLTRLAHERVLNT